MYLKRIVCFLEWIDPDFCFLDANMEKVLENYDGCPEIPFQKSDWSHNDDWKKDDEVDTCKDDEDKSVDSYETPDGNDRAQKNQP